MECPIGATTLEHLFPHLDDRPVETGETTRRGDELSLLHVLVAHETAEGRIGFVSIERELRQLAHGAHWIETIHVHVLLGHSNVFVGPFESGDVELFLGTKVVVDHPFRGAGLRRNLVNARSGEASISELIGRDVQNLELRSFGVALSLANLFGPGYPTGHNALFTRAVQREVYEVTFGYKCIFDRHIEARAANSSARCNLQRESISR